MVDVEVEMMEVTVTTAQQRAMNAMALPMPCKRSFANFNVLFGAPAFWNSAVGFMRKTMPVNDRSNSSMWTFTMPRAGSSR